MKKDSVIRPGDIPVKANRYKTVLSPVVSDLAASLLVDPLEMGVKPIPSVPVDFLGLDSKDSGKIGKRREKVDNLLKKYEEG